jgi:hypothetical protein
MSTNLVEHDEVGSTIKGLSKILILATFAVIEVELD